MRYVIPNNCCGPAIRTKIWSGGRAGTVLADLDTFEEVLLCTVDLAKSREIVRVIAVRSVESVLGCLGALVHLLGVDNDSKIIADECIDQCYGGRAPRCAQFEADGLASFVIIPTTVGQRFSKLPRG